MPLADDCLKRSPWEYSLKNRGLYLRHDSRHGIYYVWEHFLGAETFYSSIETKASHYNDAIMSAMVSLIPSLTVVYSPFIQCVDQRIHQSSASLAFERGIHWWPVNSPHKGPVTRKMLPFDDVIIYIPHTVVLSFLQLPFVQATSILNTPLLALVLARLIRGIKLLPQQRDKGKYIAPVPKETQSQVMMR